VLVDGRRASRCNLSEGIVPLLPCDHHALVHTPDATSSSGRGERVA
jgi:hypothetical protein